MDSQMREPLYSAPMKGRIGKMSRMRPNSRQVYFQRPMRSIEGTRMMVATMSAMPANSQIICLPAVSGDRRRTKQMPMPHSRKAMGSSAGSALGANLRSAMCATKKLTTRPIGTANELNVSVVLALTSSIKNSSSNTGAAAIKSQSSVARLDLKGISYWASDAFASDGVALSDAVSGLAVGEAAAGAADPAMALR